MLTDVPISAAIPQVTRVSPALVRRQLLILGLALVVVLFSCDRDSVLVNFLIPQVKTSPWSHPFPRPRTIYCHLLVPLSSV